MPATNATYFPDAASLRRWLARHHAAVRELIVGFHKRAGGTPSITYPEALDEALCFGWIDGVRRSVDAVRYTVRFTPRKPKSYWSAVNVRKALALVRAGRMRKPGLAAFEARDPKHTERYSFEQSRPRMPSAELKAFKANAGAWAFWSAQPPGYRKVTTFFVASAKKPETRARRLALLIECSAQGRRIPQLSRQPKAAGA